MPSKDSSSGGNIDWEEEHTNESRDSQAGLQGTSMRFRCDWWKNWGEGASGIHN